MHAWSPDWKPVVIVIVVIVNPVDCMPPGAQENRIPPGLSFPVMLARVQGIYKSIPSADETHAGTHNTYNRSCLGPSSTSAH